MAIIELDIQDFLPLGQGDVHRPTASSANQWLSLSQVARTSLTVDSLRQLYSPVQDLYLQRSIRILGLTDSFIMYQHGAKSHAEDIIDIFFMWQAARPIEYSASSHSLTLTQLVELVRAKLASTTLVMTDAATYVSVRARNTVSNFTPASRVSGYMRKKYSYSIELPVLTGPNAPEC